MGQEWEGCPIWVRSLRQLQSWKIEKPGVTASRLSILIWVLQHPKSEIKRNDPLPEEQLWWSNTENRVTKRNWCCNEWWVMCVRTGANISAPKQSWMGDPCSRQHLCQGRMEAVVSMSQQRQKSKHALKWPCWHNNLDKGTEGTMAPLGKDFLLECQLSCDKELELLQMVNAPGANSTKNHQALHMVICHGWNSHKQEC